MNSQIIFNEIKSLSNHKAPGIDGIRPQDLKTMATDIADIIAHFINASVKQGAYHHNLKTGIVRPIYKKGSQTDYNNYRPIIILSAIDKIVGKIYV